MWERTLQDLIRGLRANKKDESKFIAQAVDEIRKEIKSKDMEIKAAAVLKLTYVCVSSSLISENNATNSCGQATHDGLRHGMGVFPCSGGHVGSKNTLEDHWISSSSGVVQGGHGRAHAYHEPAEEGE